MKKFTLIFSMSLALMNSSCGILDVEPVDFLTTEQYYETDGQVDAALTSVYKTFNKIYSAYGQEFNGNTDEIYVYNAPQNSLQNYTYDATNKTILSFWNNLYAGIKNINFLLDGIERNKSKLSEDVYLHAKGESLFLRGYFNFLLVQWYCSNEKGFGIPMPLEIVTSYEDTRMPIVSMSAIYEQIVKDMEDAIPLLQDQTFASLGYSERVTIDAVYGILSRVSLYAAGYPNNGGEKGKEHYYNEALKYGLEVTRLGHKLLDNYCDVFKDECQDKYNTETIWEVGYKYNGIGADTENSNISGWLGSAFGLPREAYDRNTGEQKYDSLLVTKVGRFVHPRLYVSYGEGDERRDWNCPQFRYTPNTMVKVPVRMKMEDFTNGHDGVMPEAKLWQVPVGKWRREDEPKIQRDRASNSTNFPLLRYSDVLLMIAEAYIELGQPAQAVPYINEVRQRAIDNPGADIVLDRIADNGGASLVGGYTFIPKVTVSSTSGSGLKLLVGFDENSLGNVSITVLDPGTGYTTAPTITVEDKKVTWTANTPVLKNQYYMASNLCIYKVCEDGTTTENEPIHKVKALSAKTSPTLEEERVRCGVPMNYVAGPFQITAPTFTVLTGKATEYDVAKLVSDINDQDAMRNFLRDERCRELCFEGLRTMDLKRWGILVETVRDMKNDLNGTETIPETVGDAIIPITSSSNSITEFNNFLPIPQTQLTLNPNLRQNVGY